MNRDAQLDSEEERRALEELKTLFANRTPMTVKATRGDLWMLIATVQMACRIPQFTAPIRKILQRSANEIAAALTQDSPILADYWRRGWDPQHDK